MPGRAGTSRVRARMKARLSRMRARVSPLAAATNRFARLA